MYVLKCANVNSQVPVYDSVGNGDGDNFRECMPTTMIKLPFWKFNNVNLAILSFVMEGLMEGNIVFLFPIYLTFLIW